MNEGKSEGADQQCPVCWSLLCEPVAWPECAHHLCLVCALRMRRRPKPMCPLCRAPANQVRQAAELQVSSARAVTVRKAVGYSSYQAQRRDTWAQVAELDAAGGLGGPLALVAGRSEVWHRLRLGTQQEVLMEPKYEELLRWSRRSKGGCFAVVLQPADIEVGAKGRVCRIVEHMESSPSERRVLVEAGAACRVIELNSKMQPAEEAMIDTAQKFVIGKLEELDEEELPARVNDLGPLAAAADIVHILGVLGRNLQAVRQRWMMTALVSLLDEDTRALENPQPEDRQGLESMLGVMMSYRQIIHQMDALLSQATATADRLIPEREDEATSLETRELTQTRPTSSEATIAREPASQRGSEVPSPQTPEPGQIVPLRSSSREPVSQVEALRRRGDVLPVAGAANVAARSVSSTDPQRSSAPRRLREGAGRNQVLAIFL
ncbi:unnamed protein product [Cladocopium goreaui]|uniref:RING-type domain-containing protein n=1 Tax=Cladocopium goreaui TaxID=2562237 RepID=A0A9P1C9A4_9DINO|nr:unnamed protein product [Cladocopium goreaui]